MPSPVRANTIKDTLPNAAMTFYQHQLQQLKETIYANEAQLDMALRARNYIRRYYHGELDLKTLAQAHRVSRFHMLRVFKRYHGQTPGQHLTDHRIHKAKEQLRTGMGITNTCCAVGLKSPGSFNLVQAQNRSVTTTIPESAIFEKRTSRP